MGGQVSTGRDNDDLVDNLKEAEYIKTEKVETVFRIVDRAHYYLPDCRESAYKDLAWKSGTLHLSAPCIYSEVMEALDLEKGLSFLNLGSGTGYLNTMVGFMIGPNGINHGIELHASNVSFAEQRLMTFKESSPKFDDLELCEPVFITGNCLNLAPDNRRYDRVYCGAACPSELISFVQNMIKIQGILVVPVGDQLLKIKRISETDFTSDNVLPVSFASLVEPSAQKDQDMIMLAEVHPMSLQDMCRITVRESIRRTFTFVKRSPKSSDTSTKQSKLLHTSRVFRQERGRYPLNILPTNHGLMIMGAFTDESDASDESEQLDDGFLDQEIQEHALVQRQRAELSLAEVVSNISDDEQKNENDGENGEKDEEKSEDDKTTNDTKEKELVGYLRSARGKLEVMQSEDGVIADDEDDDEMETKEMPSVKESESEDEELKEKMATSHKKRDGKFSEIMMTRNVTVNGKTKRMKYPMLIRKSWAETRELLMPSENQHSLSSEDEAIVAESNVNSSPAIEMNVFDSTARNTKTSYSTSAETSETSGFGSLGDDQIHIGSLHSGLGNMEDDVIEDRSDRSSSDIPSRPNKSTGEFSLWSNFGVSATSESDDDESDSEDNDDEDDSVEEAWMDIDEDVRGSNENGKKTVSEGTVDNDKKREEGEEASPPVLPPSGFTVFLKKQVDTLPLPNTLKSYICYFR